MRFAAIWLVVISLSLSGCDLFQSKEKQCLVSDRLSFKDPDSLAVVENLGKRNESSDENPFFWLRYKAKNGYGAYDSRNMVCVLEDGKWVRGHAHEQRAVEDVLHKLLAKLRDELHASNMALEACKTAACRASNKHRLSDSILYNTESTLALEEKRLRQLAEDHVFEALAPLK